MVAIIPDNFEEAYVNQHVSLVRVDSRLNPKFIAWFLSSFDGGQQQFKNLQRGVIKTGLGLNDIRSIWIPFPSLEEQKIIVEKIEECVSVISQKKSQLDSLLMQLDILKSVILKYAFEGKLVPQDPNDEPVEILLQKIKQEKEQLKQKQKTSRRSKNVK
ncbi:Type-1 restriction enzyme EcoAI specificity protein [Marine Group I thaumarchaeote SCGC AAA799-P11]|uniref:Type-1 restriction enzyme EcoAI specificity protein n=1 Tax=Marine Group I thaumarchaeote SCGC AAA799-P11 TaxID=1502295 RepID=A0A087RXZ5_9ARCH|nr:Type-1 restriction enzyme EcoAI specificity protein [Marine Group I thaumarchaeote SCGC AAA799-P11]